MNTPVELPDHWLLRWLATHAPRAGWLPAVLLVAVLGILVAAVRGVGWVPEDGVVMPAAMLGFLLAALLAEREADALPAWLLLTAAGLALTIAILAELRFPFELLDEGAPAIGEVWRQSLALFFDRVGGWLKAVTGGGSSTETLAFAWLLGLGGWFLGAWLAWSAFALRRPYWGLTAVGLALALVTYFGGAPLYWTVFYVGLAITAAAVLAFRAQEAAWDACGIDYSAETRTDLLVYAGSISLVLMSLAMALPAINVRAIAEAFQRQEAVIEAEETLERAFAGVAQTRREDSTTGGNPGVLPRAFLLGGAPELQQTVVMTASVTAAVAGTALGPQDATGLTSGLHWRGASYDVYTGRGWLRSPEREELLFPGAPFPLSPEEREPAGQTITMTQQVEWLHDTRMTRYTLGRPLSIDQTVKLYWRGLDDLVRVASTSVVDTRYEAESFSVLASPAELASARLEDVPPEILARYTKLPAGIPPRVRTLALEVTGAAGAEAGPGTPQPAVQLSPYDQARAIESFLHQFPYSLDIGPPPDDVDMVDYFLFDLQRGFCDYYATAMVVMARMVGLPARLGIGYLPQPVGAGGVQTIRQSHAHSWAEIYFAGYGWVEFEPTAPFAAAPSTAAPPGVTPFPTYAPPLSTPVPVPPRAPSGSSPWTSLAIFAGGLAALYVLWLRLGFSRRGDQGAPLDDIQIAYGRLQTDAAALGFPPRPNQTPAEFSAALGADLRRLAAGGNAGALELVGPAERLAELFNIRQYRHGLGTETGAAAEARALSRGTRRIFRRVRFRQQLAKVFPSGRPPRGA